MHITKPAPSWDSRGAGTGLLSSPKAPQQNNPAALLEPFSAAWLFSSSAGTWRRGAKLGTMERNSGLAGQYFTAAFDTASRHSFKHHSNYKEKSPRCLCSVHVEAVVLTEGRDGFSEGTQENPASAGSCLRARGARVPRPVTAWFLAHFGTQPLSQSTATQL